MSSQNTLSKVRLLQILQTPLIAHGLLFGVYIGWVKKEYAWFSWHPFFMLVGFVILAGNAALIKKIGGRVNTITHGIMMTGATLCAAFAYYVIYSNKEKKRNSPTQDLHLTTLHGKLGLTCFVGYIGLTLFGLIALHPDFGALKSNTSLRAFHKWAGRLVTAAAWSTCVLGYMEIDDKTNMMQFLFVVPLLVMGYFVLL
jgi:hypothetical protein